MIFRETSLSMATCGNTINDMLEDNEVIQVDREELQMGRPVARFTYNRDYLHVMGVSIFTENHKYTAKIVITDALGGTLRRRRCDYQEFEYADLLQLYQRNCGRIRLLKALKSVFRGSSMRICSKSVIFSLWQDFNCAACWKRSCMLRYR